MTRKVIDANFITPSGDGENVEFLFEYEDGTIDQFVASHGSMVEISDALLTATKECAALRTSLGKTYTPLPQNGIVRQFDLSSFAALRGRDGVPRLAYTYDNGAIILLRLTQDDAKRWRALLDRVISGDLSEE